MLSLYQKRRVTQAFRHAWVCLMHALENTNSWCLYDVNECRLFMRGKVSFFKKKKDLYLLQESTGLLKQQTMTHELEAPTE